jgi:hypothetical protein
MKTKFTTLLLLCALITRLNAQVNVYTFSSSIAPYVAITGGTVVGTTTDDDAIYGPYNIGFPFLYIGCETSFYMCSNGFIKFQFNSLPSTSPISINNLGGNLISALGGDLLLGIATTATVVTGSSVAQVGSTLGIAVGDVISSGSGFPAATVVAVGVNQFTASATATTNITGGQVKFNNGEMRCQTIGTTPHQTLVAQWKNVRHWGKLDYFNFQIRLEESTNHISISYGNLEKGSVSNGYEIGLRGNGGINDYSSRTTSANWLSTTASIASNAVCTLTNSAIPPSGLQFNWKKTGLITSIGGQYIACPGSTVTITASGASTYTWNNTSVGPSISMAAGTSVTHTITGTTTSGCLFTDVFTHSISAHPSPTVSVNSATICAGSTNFTITPSGASSFTINGYSNLNNLVIFSYTTGLNTFTVQGTTINGCISPIATSTLFVKAAPTISLNIGTFASSCDGDSITILPSGSASTYTINGNYVPTMVIGSGSINILPSSTGYINIIGVGANGCSSAFNSLIQLFPLPTLSVTASNSLICAGQTTSLSVMGADTYTWNTLATTSVIAISPTVTTTYTVNGTDIYGCKNDTTLTLTVNPLPNVLASTNTTLICAGQTASLSALGANSYTWSTVSTLSNITITPTSTTTYTLLGSNSNGCINSSTIVQNVSVCLGIASNLSTNQTNFVAVYPNPTTGKIIIASTISDAVSYEIINTLGKLLQNGSLTGIQEIDLGEYKDGIYVVKIMHLNQTQFIKVIKQ